MPLRRPVEVLKLAHAGLFAIEYVSGLLSASDALGVNEYATPVVALPDGVPLIVGGWFGMSRTWIENAGSATLTWPSFTEMTMFE